jgi:hypothetical protein
VPAKYAPQLLTAELLEHFLYIDSDLLECAKDDKSIKILLIKIKKINAYYFSSQQGIVHHEESQGQTLHRHFYVQKLSFCNNAVRHKQPRTRQSGARPMQHDVPVY